LPRTRLHTRTIVRDRHQTFIGSQSLRELELDARREVGVIVRDSALVNSLAKIFEQDWASAVGSGVRNTKQKAPAKLAKVTTKAARAIATAIAPTGPDVAKAIQRVVGGAADINIDHAQLGATVKDAIRDAVEGAVKDVVEEAVEQK
jgi:phosphatidylserine/phosphatidylglycerophosphate/cardiolipin synthase-like enzyme